MYVCSYYTNMYSCMGDWLQSQANCSSKVVTVIMDAVLRFSVPFTSNYNCSIVRNPTTAG